MPATWYYFFNDQKIGPVSESRIRNLVESGDIGSDTYMWCEGMDEWKPAKDISGLLAVTPPPMPSSAQSPETTTTSGVLDLAQNMKQARKDMQALREALPNPFGKIGDGLKGMFKKVGEKMQDVQNRPKQSAPPQVPTGDGTEVDAEQTSDEPPPQDPTTEAEETISREDVFRGLTQFVIQNEACNSRRYRKKEIDIPTALRDIEEYLSSEIGCDAIEVFQEEDSWTFPLSDKGAVILKGEPNDLLLKVYLAIDNKALNAEAAKAGVCLAGVGAASLAATAVGFAAVTGVTALSAFLIPLAPVVIGAAAGSVVRRRRLVEEVKQVEQSIAEHIDQHIIARLMKSADRALPDSTGDITDKIKKLAELRDIGAITEEEFTAKKKQLLAAM